MKAVACDYLRPASNGKPGAALLEERAGDARRQPIGLSFRLPLPSAQAVPVVEIVRHATPSPPTVLGQKGSGEAGYLGATALLASAVDGACARATSVYPALPMGLPPSAMP
jgi:2-furoyl-CoA dehydrogenase large subunit